MSELLDGTDLMGVVGGCFIALSLVPQVWKAYQTKSAEDISYTYQVIYIIGITLLNAYALILGLWPIYIPALVEEALLITLTLMKLIYCRRQTKQVNDSRHSGVPIPLDNATKSKLPISMSTTDESKEETNKVDIETGDSIIR
jgi:MtN3 and saliva related transmembrane protein